MGQINPKFMKKTTPKITLPAEKEDSNDKLLSSSSDNNNNRESVTACSASSTSSTSTLLESSQQQSHTQKNTNNNSDRQLHQQQQKKLPTYMQAQIRECRAHQPQGFTFPTNPSSSTFPTTLPIRLGPPSKPPRDKKQEKVTIPIPINTFATEFPLNTFATEFTIPINNFATEFTNIDDFGIRVRKVDVDIEKKRVQIDEKSSKVLRYKTPNFNAFANVRFPPLGPNEIWKLGWIQACTYMQFTNTYGDLGFSSWELPGLNKGSGKRMVGDSDGKNFPFYGDKNEVQSIEGPTNEHTFHSVTMNDHFRPHITWDTPISTDKDNNSDSINMDRILSDKEKTAKLAATKRINQKPSCKLTHVKRHQKFVTWLVALDMARGRLHVIQTFKWRMRIEIDVDPTKELGQRGKLVTNDYMNYDGTISNTAFQKPVRALTTNIPIPECALFPTSANSSQRLVWRAGPRARPEDPGHIIPTSPSFNHNPFHTFHSQTSPFTPSTPNANLETTIPIITSSNEIAEDRGAFQSAGASSKLTCQSKQTRKGSGSKKR